MILQDSVRAFAGGKSRSYANGAANKNPDVSVTVKMDGRAQKSMEMLNAVEPEPTCGSY